MLSNAVARALFILSVFTHPRTHAVMDSNKLTRKTRSKSIQEKHRSIGDGGRKSPISPITTFFPSGSSTSSPLLSSTLKEFPTPTSASNDTQFSGISRSTSIRNSQDVTRISNELQILSSITVSSNSSIKDKSQSNSEPSLSQPTTQQALTNIVLPTIIPIHVDSPMSNTTPSSGNSDNSGLHYPASTLSDISDLSSLPRSIASNGSTSPRKSLFIRHIQQQQQQLLVQQTQQRQQQNQQLETFHTPTSAQSPFSTSSVTSGKNSDGGAEFVDSPVSKTSIISDAVSATSSQPATSAVEPEKSQITNDQTTTERMEPNMPQSTLVDDRSTLLDLRQVFIQELVQMKEKVDVAIKSLLQEYFDDDGSDEYGQFLPIGFEAVMKAQKEKTSNGLLNNIMRVSGSMSIKESLEALKIGDKKVDAGNMARRLVRSKSWPPSIFGRFRVLLKYVYISVLD